MFDVSSILNNRKPDAYYTLSILLRVKGNPSPGFYKFGCVVAPEGETDNSFGVMAWSNNKFAPGTAYLTGSDVIPAIVRKLNEKLKSGRYELVEASSHQILSPSIYSLLCTASSVLEWMLNDLQVNEVADACAKLRMMAQKDRTCSRISSDQLASSLSYMQREYTGKGRVERKIAEWTENPVFSGHGSSLVPFTSAINQPQKASASPTTVLKKVEMEKMAESWGEWA